MGQACVDLGVAPESRSRQLWPVETVASACAGTSLPACPGFKLIGIHRPGAYAEYSVVPAVNLEPIPEVINDIAAAALIANGPVARAQLDAAQVRVLIPGAAGALGSMVLALARYRGAQVIATSRQPEMQEWLGNQDVIVLDPAASDFVERVLAVTGLAGVDAIVDNIADSTLWQRMMVNYSQFWRYVSSSVHRKRMDRSA